jgi:hypothetical protein
MTLAQAVSGGRSTEVTFGGVVTTAPRFLGTRSGMHELFRMQSDDGVDLEIADNVSIAARCPVVPGDRIEVRGEFSPAYADGSPLVHWTHRDPCHRHTDGFIELDGRRYQ